MLNLHSVPYPESLHLQERLVRDRREKKMRDLLMILEHPSVITITSHKNLRNLLVSMETLQSEGITICSTNRGGDITYHGPGQLVGYLVMDLNEHGKDLHRYVASVEEMIVGVLKEYDIPAHADAKYPGVWVDDAKIAAIGIAVKRGWITMHGFSLNIDPSLSFYSYIVPCGLRDKKITSMRKVLGTSVDTLSVRQRLGDHFGEMFNLRVRKIALVDVLKREHEARMD